jgi:L-xylulokinase
MTKAVLFDLEGRELACERRRNPINFPARGHTERDPDAMWSDACAAIRSLVEQAAANGWEVHGVAATGYGSGLYLIDEAGRPVRPGIMSTDTRAADLIERWRLDNLTEHVGRQIQQRLWPGQSAVLLAWLAENEPSVIDRTHSVLLCKDFIRYRLCGDISTDPTDAGVSGLLDVSRQTYAKDAIRELGAAGWLGKLPPIGSSTDVVGGISATTARLTGLRQGTPVVRGLVDISASAVASGINTPTQLSVVAGTFSINSTLHEHPRTSHLPFVQSSYPIGNVYIATEGSATSASNLEWFCKSVLGGGAARAVASGRSIYDVCNELVVGSKGRPNDILFFPFVFGGPGGAPAGMLGLSAFHELGDIVRAIYECIAFAHRRDIQGLLVGSDAARPTTIRLAGGASRSAVWAQIFADVLDLPVEIAEGSELGALGAAMCASAALRSAENLSSAAARMSRVSRRLEPDRESGERLRDKRLRYDEAVEYLARNYGKSPIKAIAE